MKRQQNPLRIRVGDVVEIYFGHMPKRGKFTAIVTGLTDRTVMGCEPYIDYRPKGEEDRDLDAERTGIPYGCSVGYVQSVVERAPYKKEPQVNIFRESIEQDPALWRYLRSGGVCVFYGFGLDTLVTLALASFNGRLDRPLHSERFREMWARDSFRGKVTVPESLVPDSESEDFWYRPVAVRWKVFKKYVLANRHRILMSRKEMEEEGRLYLKDMERIYEEDRYVS